MKLKTRRREALSLDQRREVVNAAIREKYPASSDGFGPWIKEFYLDYAIFEDGEGADLYRLDYSIDATGTVTLGERTKVQVAYVPIAEAFVEIREAIDARTFDVVVIRAGLSLNGRLYTKELLWEEETAKAFEGAVVNAQRFGDELDHIWDESVDKSQFALNTVGVLENVHPVDDELHARLVIHEGADFVAGLLALSVERVAAGLQALVGLSIDGFAVQIPALHEGKEVLSVARFAPNATVDIVSRPAAGGEIVRLAASLGKEITMPDPKKAPPGDGTAAAVKEAPPIDLEQVRASVKADVVAELKAEQEARDKARAETLAKIKESEELLKTTLKESNLPDHVQGLVRRHFESSTFKKEELEAWIADARKGVKEGDRTGQVNVPSLKVGTGPRDKAEIGLYHMFMQNSRESTRLAADKQLKEAGLAPIHSLHRWTRECFGVDLSDGAFGSTDERRRLTESLTTSSWTDVFGDVMNKSLLDAYHDNDWSDWRKIVRIKPLKDFMTQHSIRMGGYSNLPAVAEGENYPAMTSPGDEEHEWTPATYGGTEDLTRRMILADDVMAISRIPVGLAYAAARTLYEYIFDLLTIDGQPTMDYDSTALFATSRTYNDNLGTTALASAEVAVVWLAMQQFTDMTSAKREAIRPKFLLVPVNLATTAFGIVKPLSMYAPGETTDNAFVRTMGLEVIVVQHWTNAKDHVYVADPALVPGFLLGFIGGRQEPEMFIQDAKNVGTVFDRDAITYKIRHEYGGSPIDHRAFYAEDVA